MEGRIRVARAVAKVMPHPHTHTSQGLKQTADTSIDWNCISYECGSTAHVDYIVE